MGIVRRLLVFAAVDGLILQPAPPRDRPPATQQAIKIDYKGNIAPLSGDRREEATTTVALEAHGVLGLLKVASACFLIGISRREQVAQIRGKPVYAVSDVVLIPLASQGEAHEAIVAAKAQLGRKSGTAEGSAEEEETDTESSEEDIPDNATDPESLHEVPTNKSSDTGGRQRRESVAENVIGKKGMYGRFLGKWFSKGGGFGSEHRRMQGMSSEEDLQRKKKAAKESEANGAKEEAGEAKKINAEDKGEAAQKDDKTLPSSPEKAPKALAGPVDSTTLSLLPKILRTTKLYFSSRNFFFCYDYDLSKPLDRQNLRYPSEPLIKQFDPLFFWNAQIARPFIVAGQPGFIMPVIQGFVGQRTFTVDTPTVEAKRTPSIIGGSTAEETFPPAEEASPRPSTDVPPTPKREAPGTKDFLLTLISRRSVRRAGLRYLRRGVDEEGNVANAVETEQLLSSPTWETEENKIFSFVQARGSIPLFFSQSPFSLKPEPVIHGSHEANAAAFKHHFQKLATRYGGVQAASLIDKHGTEAKIGELFEKHANSLNAAGGVDGKGTSIGFEWFDFHNVCRGMRFENISELMDSLKPTLTKFGHTVQKGESLSQKQNGILRTNCMDCLDRTNVVQSAFARAALEDQLAVYDISIDLQTDPRTSWFNTLWADNGDAISRQYAGTAALKGDFTRTRHRNIGGALTDFGLTLTRYYNNIVNDYFTQALIDYLLGRATESIFAEFEADMKAQDYAIDLRKVRQAAIDRSAELVIERPDEEDLVAGWTLGCPAEGNTLRTLPFEECVLLLTEKALYFCRLDWTTEKVKEFERVDLLDLESLRRGTYVTSTLAQRHMDEDKNVGFVVKFHNDGRDLVRVNTRSLESEKPSPSAKKSDRTSSDHNGVRILAFKALPPKSSYKTTNEGEEEEDLSERESVRCICEEIVRQANLARRMEGAEDESLGVEEKDVISVAEAKKQTGMFEQLGYNLKRLVWT